MRALLLACLLAAPASAARPLTPPAPDFPPGAAWINSKPLSLELLRGRKATVVAFLNLTSANSLRALPALKGWFDRYALSQLMVVGVLSPDLEMHRDPLWARAQLKRLGVEFPVVLDGERSLWTAYANEGWPALYLVDRKGQVVYDRLGEGGYLEFENELRASLSELVGEDLLPAPVEVPEPPTTRCGQATGDIPLGARSKRKPLSLDKNGPRRSSLVVESRLGEVATRGRWSVESDGLRLAQTDDRHSSFLRVVYAGAQALAVLAPPPERAQGTKVFVKQNDLWLHEGNAGRDVRFDADGRSFVHVDAPRLYHLVRDPAARPHELSLAPDRRHVGIYGFTFENSCLKPPPP